MPMPAFTDITGLLGIAIALGATVIALPGLRRLSRGRVGGIFFAVMILSVVPFGPLSAAACVRGAFGDLSITALVLLGGATLRRLTGAAPVESRARFAMLVFVAVAALALYPMALGIGRFDPYHLGYGSPWFAGVLCVAALAAWFGRCDVLAVCIALATLAWSVRWYESTNLWDYLLDPLVSFYALGALVVCGVRAIRATRAVSNSDPAPASLP